MVIVWTEGCRLQSVAHVEHYISLGGGRNISSDLREKEHETRQSTTTTTTIWSLSSILVTTPSHRFVGCLLACCCLPNTWFVVVFKYHYFYCRHHIENCQGQLHICITRYHNTHHSILTTKTFNYDNNNKNNNNRITQSTTTLLCGKCRGRVDDDNCIQHTTFESIMITANCQWRTICKKN